MINSPCHYCADRTLGCHGYCFNYMKYVTALKKSMGKGINLKLCLPGMSKFITKICGKLISTEEERKSDITNARFKTSFERL